ncbi:hypothetical protein BGW36DRAFT_431239 [Talaromyces proteolyticus]|uniref:C2H2-type domain-containing protein n=1 Tax=Talaromyces proteolyticus TaxID=1131652 RepID=A0AAD4KIH3_9EURO|nr:uncharacterized protein BGW36DRAFT_431239 [Talaromyces proteolyticus]KAH8692002.1 hypothetical protein BGW36DRAFT_431239 [Talaromyces proteolyticus]
MNQDFTFPSYVETPDDKMMYPQILPPLNPLHAEPSYGLDHTSFTNLDRRTRLESRVMPLEELVVRGHSDLSFPRMSIGPDATYHVPETLGKEEPYDCVPLFYECEYPSPPGPPATDLSSISETDRSPSPGNFAAYSLNPIQHGHMFEPSIQDFDGYGSVTPREVEHYPEPFTEPECCGDKVAQIYPCPTSYHSAEGGLVTHDMGDDMDDDVDADGDEDDQPRNSYLESQQSSLASMPRTKTPSSLQRKKTPKAPSPRTRKSGPRHDPGYKSKARSNPKNGAADRLFFCSFKQYGCPSTFNSKNEWKRHIASQHLKLGFWRCDLPGCGSTDKVPNDFNRKDLFTQHLRRMHNPGNNKNAKIDPNDDFEHTLREHHTRCWLRQRSPPPQTKCAECNIVFTSWEERMEHMGKHYESGSFSGEAEDPNLVGWALREGILCREGSSKVILSSLLKTRRRK